MAQENDIVLIYFEDKPLFFARIEEILPDSKPDWYHVKLLVLQEPVQVVTWILRNAYINGEEFTMNNKKMRMERVVSPEDQQTQKTSSEANETGEPSQSPKDKKSADVISLKDLKKK